MNIIQRIIPAGNKNRPGVYMAPDFITVHNTSNVAKGADAIMHAKYLENGAGGRSVSWHYTVDDKNIVQHLPDKEQGWHAGSTPGNKTSIGIEICEHEGINQAAAEQNAIELIRHLMKKHQIPLSNVVPHKHWTGKNCPHLLLPRWQAFIQKVQTPIVEGFCKVKAQGLEVEGVIIGSTSYVPVRELAELLGASVTWDPKTNTVNIDRG